jgi:glyceraldehyde-3-phosphate dehydrogenase/erythrose-4-phosphate dehydrogenase
MVAMSKRIAVVGLGRLGACPVRALHHAGVQVVGLADETVVYAQQLADYLSQRGLCRYRISTYRHRGRSLYADLNVPGEGHHRNSSILHTEERVAQFRK